MPLRKPWQPWPPPDLRRIPATVGVYELADDAGKVVYIGMAGGRTRFGLRGVLADHFADGAPNRVIAQHARQFRYEVVQMYMSRYIDLLEQHYAAAGELPPANREPGERVPTFGRRRA